MRTLVLILLVTTALPIAMPTAEAYACGIDPEHPEGYVQCEVNWTTRCAKAVLRGDGCPL